MKAHTQQFKEQIKKFGRELDSQITYTLDNEEIVLGNEQLNAITPHYEGDILKSVMKQLDIDSNVEIPIGTEVNYKFGVKTRSGKNLFDKDNITNTLFYDVNDGHIISFGVWSQSQFIAVDNTQKYTLQSSYTTLNNSFEITQFDINQNWIKGQQASMGNGYFVIGTDITFNNNTKYIRIGFRNDRIDTSTMQLELGNTATSYEKFGMYEYLDYGNYIVYDSEKQEDTKSYKIVCYDKMLYAMKDYESLNVQYPITIKNYLSALCTKIGLTLKDTNFVNYDKEITNELYLDTDGNSLNYTYRDVLDEIAGATASTICINEDDELEVRYIKEYKLPSGYSELDYIQSSGTQYIDTGVLAGPNKTIKMKVEPLSIADQVLYGARQENNYSFFYITQSYSSVAWQYQVGNNWYKTPNNSLETNKVYEIESYLGQTSQSFKYNDNTITSSVNVSNHEYTYNDYLFAGNRYGSVIQNASIKLYNCEVYLNNEKIRHFIPALRNSDNKVGLYDIVNDVFYTNKGTGDFTYGSIVNESVDLIDEEYLKDINVNFGEKYGPVNSVVFSRSAESDNIYRQDETSIEQNGLHEIKIIDNQILNANNRGDFIDGVYNQLNGFEYYANDFSSTGIAYYDLCDRYNVRVEDNIYSCIMMNDELDVSQGLEEKVHLDIPEKSETDYKKADTTDRKVNQAWLIVNKQEQTIQGLVSKTSILDGGVYTKEQVDDLLINSETGLTNTFSEAGGNNIFRNTGLWFENDDENNPYEFWTGVVVRIEEKNAINMNALSLQNTTVSQQQVVSNGSYTISFKYKKLFATANASVFINGVEYQLLDSIEEEQEAESEKTIEVQSQSIDLDFVCDMNNGFEIYDLMVNAGQVKLAYSQNQNETTTDTVNISKGITITSSDLDVTFKANADGIRTLDNNNNILTQFTDEGMTTKTAIIESKSQIVGTLWQEVETQHSSVQTWITKL